MKKFKVNVIRTTYYSTDVEVEAGTGKDAEREAIKKLMENDATDWKMHHIEKFNCEAERVNPPYDTVDFPAYALSALINDDVSGISADDLKHLHNWTREVETRIRASHGQKCQIIYDPGEATYFSTAQVFGLPCECVELEIHVIPENPLHEENQK